MRKPSNGKNSAPPLEALKDDILAFAKRVVRRKGVPYLTDTPAEQTARVQEIIDALNRARSLLRPLVSAAGQKTDKSAFDWPLVQRLQDAQLMREGLAGTQRGRFSRGGAGEYPTQFIRDLEGFIADAETVLDQIRPTKGNAVDRDRDAQMKSQIACEFVSRYHDQFGALPPTTKEGTAAIALSEIFEEVELSPPNGDYWIRKVCARVRDA